MAKSNIIAEEKTEELRTLLDGTLKVITKKGKEKDAEVAFIYNDGTVALRVKSDRMYEGKPWPLHPSARVPIAEIGSFMKTVDEAKIKEGRALVAKYTQETPAVAPAVAPVTPVEKKEKRGVAMHKRVETSIDLTAVINTCLEKAVSEGDLAYAQKLLRARKELEG